MMDEHVVKNELDTMRFNEIVDVLYNVYDVKERPRCSRSCPQIAKLILYN